MHITSFDIGVKTVKHKKWLFLIPLFLLLFSFTPLNTPKYKIKKIILDAGHGGKDPGCHGKKSNEAEITLKVALELGRIIKENMPEVQVMYTRDKDVFVELHDRAAKANKNNADLFISIHCNSGPSHVSGTETFTMGLHTTDENLEVAKRENAVILKEDNYKKKYDGFDINSPMNHILMANYQKAYLDNSLKLAGKIENQFVKSLGKDSRGVKQAGLLVLWKTYMPAVLIEIGFLTNKKEEKYMNDKKNRVLIASCIYRAVKEYKKETER